MQALRLEYVDPASLTENPLNWRMHPDGQRDALDAVLDEVGWAGAALSAGWGPGAAAAHRFRIRR